MHLLNNVFVLTVSRIFQKYKSAHMKATFVYNWIFSLSYHTVFSNEENKVSRMRIYLAIEG